MQARKHTSKGSTLALKPRADVTRSPKQGYQWPHTCPPKILKKTNKKKPSYRIAIYVFSFHGQHFKSLMNNSFFHLNEYNSGQDPGGAPTK